MARPGEPRRLRPTDALLDTGADLSAVAPLLWKEWRTLGLLEELPFAPGSTPEPLQVAGGSFRYRLGRVWVETVEYVPGAPANVLPAAPVIARLLEKSNKLLEYYPLILGLHRGILDGRRLVREPVPVQQSAPDIDCGPRYGQQWYLETAP